MFHNLKYIVSALTLPMLLTGCRDDAWYEPAADPNGSIIKINSEILQEYASRANDSGFADGDAIGVFIVDYSNGDATALQQRGNHADNVKYTFNESEFTWSSSAKLYWTDSRTHIDAYSYYPFREMVESVTEMPLTVQTRQDKEVGNTSLSGYEASDFLWAKAENVSPGNTINLMHNHRMASVQVSLVKGEGFGDEWSTLDKLVTVQSTVTEATANLATGIVTVDPNAMPKAIYPYHNGDNWRCIVAPQTVDGGNALISITIDEDSYELVRETSIEYAPSKLHKFTIQVDKRQKGDYIFTLIDESVIPWENDQVSHQASARVYTVVHVAKPGTIEEAVKAAKIIPENVDNLKLTGTMNMDDFEYFKHNFTNISSLNMKELRTVDIAIINGWTDAWAYGIYDDHRLLGYDDRFDDALPGNLSLESGWGGNDVLLQKLQHIILPDHCKYIGQSAFQKVPITGVVDIPEGVIWIGDFFVGGYGSGRYHLTRLNLPSTLVYIGDGAFGGYETNGGSFSNELILPESLKYIGNSAFQNCAETYGDIHLPSGLEYIGRAAFSNCGVSGTAVFPAGTKVINGAVFAGSKITSLYIPEGVEEIGDEAFWERGDGGLLNFGSHLQGDLILPKSLKKLGRNAFAGTKISHVSIPPTLETIGQDAFRECHYLMDTIVIPEGIRRIYGGAFSGCYNVSAVILPSTMEVLGGSLIDWDWGSPVFDGCAALEYFRCDAVVPPSLVGNALGGMFGNFDEWDEYIPKDNFTLVVPEQSVEAYQAAPYWSEFKRISAYRNLVFRPQIAKVLNKGGKREVILNADAGRRWQVTHCPEWLHISSTSGVGKTQLTIDIDAMSRGSENRKDEITVQLEGTDYTTAFKVSQYDYEYDEDQSYTIQEHSKGRGVDLVFVGDGYDAEDISTGQYLEDMTMAAEQFFDIEPYKTYRQYFNVYTAFAMSCESGIGSVNYLRDSKFDTSYGNGSLDSRINSKTDAVAYYCLDNTPVKESDFSRLTCILVANGSKYDGVTMMYTTGTAVAICPKSTAGYPNDARGLIQHEAGGHAFGKLADEYRYHTTYIQSCPCICCEHVNGLLSMQANGWGYNLSLSGKTVDVPWRHMLHDARVNDIVDIWEGGYFHAHGVYRSEYNSCMNNNVPYFSTWCRELIVRRIMDYAGEVYDYEKFIANDSREWGRDFTLGSRAYQPHEHTAMEGNHPVIVNGSPKRSNINLKR